MKVLIWFVVMLLSVSLQSTMIPAIAMGGVRPDLVLVVVVSTALANGRETGVLCGIFGGILQDLLSAGPFGVNTLAKMVVGLLVGMYEHKVNKKNLLMPFVAVSAGTLAAAVVNMLFLLGYGQREAFMEMMLLLSPTLAYHLILMVPVHFCMLWLKRVQEKN